MTNILDKKKKNISHKKQMSTQIKLASSLPWHTIIRAKLRIRYDDAKNHQATASTILNQTHQVTNPEDTTPF